MAGAGLTQRSEIRKEATHSVYGALIPTIVAVEGKCTPGQTEKGENGEVSVIRGCG